MPGLTRDVIGALTTVESAALGDVLSSVGMTYDAATASPNIEQIADLVFGHWITTSESRMNDLVLRLKSLILERLLAVEDPILDHHCRFFEALKKRTFGLPSCVWIFTTNYDLLFETAAARCGVALENGYSGTTHRFFNPSQLRSCSGTVSGQKFSQAAHLTVKLIKLHGSISWFESGGRFYEQHPSSLKSDIRRVMILPHRKKVMDTLVPPYDTLFTHATKILGADCKYLSSCGFSFADDHISEHILLPAMQSLRCKLFALSAEEPVGIAPFKGMPNFGGGFDTHLHLHGNRVEGTTTMWKFSNFVQLFE